METDGLLAAPIDRDLGNKYQVGACSNKQTASNWVLVAVVTILSIILLFDISLHYPTARTVGVDEDEGISTSLRTSPTSTRFDPHTNGRYYATQFLSFTINTLGGSAKHGECKGKAVDNNTDLCYLGDPDIEKDVLHRLEVFEDVLKTLRNDVFKEDPEVDRDPRVLKILMLPEFFLRGPNGAYSTKELFDSDNDEEDGILIQLADKVRALIADPAWQDYLFVLGTVIATEFVEDADDKITADDFLYYNFAPVYRGGIPQDDSTGHVHQYVILKQYISNADFLSRTTLPNPSKYDKHAYAKMDKSAVLADTFAKRNVTVVTDNFLIIDGIKIGIEICLDHRMGSLWNNVRTKHQGQLVDVQLVTSAGMSIERGPNPLVTGGVVYLSDGEASSAACVRSDTGTFDPNHVCRGKPDGLKHVNPHGGPGYSNFITLSGCIDMEQDKLLEGYYSQHLTQGCAWTLKTYGVDVMGDHDIYPPSIEIYPTISLPEREM